MDNKVNELIQCFLKLYFFSLRFLREARIKLLLRVRTLLENRFHFFSTFLQQVVFTLACSAENKFCVTHAREARRKFCFLSACHFCEHVFGNTCCKFLHKLSREYQTWILSKYPYQVFVFRLDSSFK